MKNIYFKHIVPSLVIMLFSLPLLAQETEDQDLLNMSLEELMDIQVVNVAKINFDNLSEVPSAVTLITAEQIANSGAKNMEEVLRNVPGFDILRTGYDPSTNVGVRGLYSTNGTNNKILFLIDDHPVRSVFYGDATVFLGNYPIENIKQIEIIRGPGSTLFGAGAFLGVINIRTKQPEKLASVSAYAGSFDTYNANAQIGKKIGQDFQVSLLLDYFQSTGQKQDVNSDLSREVWDPVANAFGYTGPSTSAVPGTTNYGRATTNINLNLKYKDFYLLTNLLNSEDETPIGPYEGLIRNTNVLNRAAYLEAGYRAKTKNQMGELLAKAYMDHYKLKSENDVFAEEMGPLYDYFATNTYSFDPDLNPADQTHWEEGQAPTRHTGGSNYVNGIELNFAYNFNNYLNVLVGGMFEHTELTNSLTAANYTFLYDPMTVNGNVYQRFETFGGLYDINEDYSWIQEKGRDVYAGFGQIDFNLKNLFKIYSMDHFKLITGVRYDGYSDAGGSINPRLALLMAPNRNLYFKGLFGKAFRAPSYVELYARNSSLSLGNPDNKPEQVYTFEGVAGYRIAKKLDINLTYFYTEIHDNIQLVPDSDPSTFRSSYTNIGDVKTSGIETELRYDFMPGGYFTSSFTVQEVLDITEGDSIVYENLFANERYAEDQKDFDPGRVPGFVYNFTGNYPVTKNINLNASLNYLGERNRSRAQTFELDDTFTPTGDLIYADDRDPIEARTIVNFSVTLTNFNFAKGLSLQCTGYNLLDANNYNPTLNIRQSDLQREGRHWGARLRYNF